jgi:hypothetical protein
MSNGGAGGDRGSLRHAGGRLRRGFPAGRRALIWSLPPLYALVAGLHELHLWRSQPLWPDANGYFIQATDFHPSIWLGGLREPLWQTLNAAPMAILGHHPTVLRVSGIFAFCALVIATQYLTREILGTAAAIVVGFVLASSEWLQFQAVQGMREEFAATIVVLIAYVAMRLRPGWRGAVLIGALAGAGAMVRWDVTVVALPAIAFAFALRRTSLRAVAASALVFGALVLPFCIGNAHKHGDPLYQSNIHAVFFRNLELAGTPGLPSRAEVRLNAYAGPRETWPHYLLVRHRPRWLAEHTAKGTVNTALADSALTVFGPGASVPQVTVPTLSLLGAPVTTISWLLMFGTFAGIWLLARRGAWPVAIIASLALLQHAPIQHLMDPRLGLAVVPFAAIAVATCVVELWARLVTAIAVRQTQAAPPPGTRLEDDRVPELIER